jgi:hypothetical protein
MEVINLDEAKPDAASANAAAGALARLQRHLFKETSDPVKLADECRWYPGRLMPKVLIG